MSTSEDPLGIVGKWFKPPDSWRLNDGLIEVISYSHSVENSPRHYYICYRYDRNRVTEQIYFFPWEDFEQLEM